MKLRKAVIPVAGLGTRMLPATKVIPKELVPVAGKPSVQWVVEAAVEAGIEQIIFVTSAGKSAIEDHFDRSPDLERVLEARGKTDLLDAVIRARSLARIISVRQAEPLGLSANPQADDLENGGFRACASPWYPDTAHLQCPGGRVYSHLSLAQRQRPARRGRLCDSGR